MFCKIIRVAALTAFAQFMVTSPASAADFRTIIAQHSKLCLDVQGGSQADNVSIIQSRCNGSNSQQFDLRSATGVGQNYFLISRLSGKCLDVPNADMGDNVPVNQYTCDGSPEQQFQVLGTQQRQHDYNIVAGHSGKCAGFANGDQRDGAQLVQAACNHVNAQIFQFVAASAQAPAQAPAPAVARLPAPVPTFTPAPARAPVPQQQFNAPARPVSSSRAVMASVGTQTDVTAFTLRNDSGMQLSVAWIDYNGQITAAGQPIVQPGLNWTVANGGKTWESHWFAISNASGFVCSIALRQGAVVNFSQLPACAGGNTNQFAGQAQQPPAQQSPATPVNWTQTLESLGLSNQTGNSFVFSCPAGGNTSAVVWGTDIYTTDSSICVAAMHRGVIANAAGGIVRLRVLGAQQAYHHSQRNGVSTQGYGPWQSSFSFY